MSFPRAPQSSAPVPAPVAPNGGHLALVAAGESQAAVVAALRAGDRGAFEGLFVEHHASLVRLAHAYAQSGAVAEEIVQDVFLSLWVSRATLDVQGPIAHYLVRAVRNRALNVKRRHRVEDRWGEPSHVAEAINAQSGATTDALVREREVVDAIRQAVAALPPGARAVYVMSREEGLRHAEIAAALGISTKTVEQQLWRAMTALRRALAPLLP